MIGRKVGENFRICQKPRSRSSLGKQADPVYQYFHRIEFIGKLAKLLKNIPAVSLDGVGTKINRYINRLAITGILCAVVLRIPRLDVCLHWLLDLL